MLLRFSEATPPILITLPPIDDYADTPVRRAADFR